MYGARLCQPWPMQGCCDLVELALSPEVTGAALMAASEFLWGRTGQQFGNCPVAFRPCRADCGPSPRIPSAGGSGWPYPALLDGRWINVGCSCSSGGCDCSFTSEVVFPDPIRVDSVVIDGVSLGATGWALYDQQRLVRTDGGQWPLCQDFTATAGPGTWIVNAHVGAVVPTMGQIAVGKLTCELARACAGVDCELPPYVTAVTRQGVSMQTALESLTQEVLTGIMLVDLFIKSVNPNNLQDRARAYSPDWFDPRS